MESGRWDGDNMESTPFLDSATSSDDSKPSVAKKLWNRFFGAFVSVTIGIYAGLLCRTMQESWKFAAIFSGESFICAALAVLIKAHALRKSITSFAIYFLASAVCSPIACWFRFKFGK
jgi:hypothetical protein